jgi:hypothetical protein
VLGSLLRKSPSISLKLPKHDKRGSIIVIQQLAIEWGIFIMFFVGYGCSFIAGTASFRTAWGIQFIPAVMLMCGLPFLPRSPRWLAKVGRTDDAIQVLANIHTGGNIDDPHVIAEWEEIWTVLAAEREAAFGWRKFIYHGMWKRTLAGFSVQCVYCSVPQSQFSQANYPIDHGNNFLGLTS